MFPRHPQTLLGVFGGAAALLMGLLPGNGWAFSEDVERTGDTELATVFLIKDGEMELMEKLGSNPCVIPGSSKDTVAYLYQTADGRYLQFVVNKASYDVDYGRVEVMTMSLNPIVSAACYQPVGGSLDGRSLNVSTGLGVRLGDSLEKVRDVYGSPSETRSDGMPVVTVRYRWDREADHLYEWTLVFRDGQLVEWTAEAIPYFIEMPG
jgi:hypothetical protein